ncbi:MAG: hypothetical protein N4A49_06160 [Marinifilaceae bacterium]|jgi:hypothetical protein|nr:hypothetical protein [Marinifilaceae bacterium]
MKLQRSFRLILICFILNLTFAKNSYCQTNTLVSIFENIRTTNRIGVNFYKYLEKTNKQDIDFVINNYQNDSLEIVLEAAYKLTSSYLRIKNDKNSTILNFLISGLKSHNQKLCTIILNELNRQNTNSFDTNMFNELNNIVLNKKYFYSELILFTAKLKNERFLESLELMKSEGKLKSEKALITYHIARSRMGVNESTEFILKVVNNEDINDEFTYQLIPKLIYTKNKEIYDFIVSIIFSDERLCNSSNAERAERITCAYRALEYIAPHIKAFPIKTTKSGDLISNDYIAALDTAREWLINNPYYTIKDN